MGVPFTGYDTYFYNELLADDQSVYHVPADRIFCEPSMGKAYSLELHQNAEG